MFMIIQQQTCELHLFHIKEHALSNISGTILRDHHYWGHSFLVFQGLYQYKVTSAVCAYTLYTLLLFFFCLTMIHCIKQNQQHVFYHQYK